MSKEYKYVEEIGGQYSFLPNEEIVPVQSKDAFNYLVRFSRKERKRLLEEIEQINGYKNQMVDSKTLEPIVLNFKRDFDIFIDEYFFMFNRMDYEDVLKKYIKRATDYHNLTLLWIFYLENFIYPKKDIQDLRNPRVIQLENFIETDPLSKRDSGCIPILEEIQNRKKLKVENYIVYNIQPLLDQIKGITDHLKIGTSLNEEFKNLLADQSLQEIIFVSGDEQVLTEEQEGIFSMVFLRILEECVYDNSYMSQNANVQKFVEKMENYVVFHFSNAFDLTKKQKNTYEKVKMQVGKRMQIYIQERYRQLLNVLKEFDRLQRFKKSGKYRMIEIGEDVSDLPISYTKEEIKLHLETFLGTVFILIHDYKTENLPIFYVEFTKERHEAMELALEYLNRFVYKETRDNKIENPIITTIEDYIYADDDFHVTKGDLCVAKSILMDRVARRRQLLKLDLSRKKLQMGEN